jgi:lipoic acid synthetase
MEQKEVQTLGNKRIPKPKWLRRNLPAGPVYEKVKRLLKKSKLHTVCQEAKCPNIWQCFSNHTSTFLIMGPTCTRNCSYCSVTTGPASPLDPDEPGIVAKASKALNLKYIVVTSVTRDDIPDGGANHFAKTISEIKKEIPDGLVEVLIPDFQGNNDALHTVIKANPNVLNHNIETVSRLFPIIRPQADYKTSLKLLKTVKSFNPKLPTKSGIMLGLGETIKEIETTMQDLLDADCSILTLGQYLQPTKKHIPVQRFLLPSEFDDLKEIAIKLGFKQVASGPLVRSSYQAKELFES